MAEEGSLREVGPPSSPESEPIRVRGYGDLGGDRPGAWAWPKHSPGLSSPIAAAPGRGSAGPGASGGRSRVAPWDSRKPWDAAAVAARFRPARPGRRTRGTPGFPRPRSGRLGSARWVRRPGCPGEGGVHSRCPIRVS